MRWQYRTIMFEFAKDGLLGDRYVDDEEMEKTLNSMGKEGWELVDVALLKDGILAFLKYQVTGEEMRVDMDLPLRETVVAEVPLESQQPVKPVTQREYSQPPLSKPLPGRPPIRTRQTLEENSAVEFERPLPQQPIISEQPAPRHSFQRPVHNREEVHPSVTRRHVIEEEEEAEMIEQPYPYQRHRLDQASYAPSGSRETHNNDNEDDIGGIRIS